jgi:hypothetical protein
MESANRAAPPLPALRIYAIAPTGTLSLNSYPHHGPAPRFPPCGATTRGKRLSVFGPSPILSGTNRGLGLEFSKGVSPRAYTGGIWPSARRPAGAPQPDVVVRIVRFVPVTKRPTRHFKAPTPQHGAAHRAGTAFAIFCSVPVRHLPSIRPTSTT